MRLFVFGLGYSALRVGRLVRDRRGLVTGTCRSRERADALAGLGFEARIWLAGGPAERWPALEGATHVLTSIPPGSEGDPVVGRFADALERAPALRWVGVLSSTGVYGDHGGAWVDESTPPAPTSARSERRLAAEREWLATGLPVHVFRLAGIYGPGRSALDRVLAGRARRIAKSGQVFSRIHVDDLAQVVFASMQAPSPGAIYNVADDEPAPSADVVAEAARLLGVASPPLVPVEDADLSPIARSFYRDNRRVSNRRIKEELGVKLRYPTYREGLAALDG